MVRVANAPCSWGILEFDRETSVAPYARVLDEMRDTGYSGTELGDWGFMPTDPAVLGNALAERQLALVGAFVPVALVHQEAHHAGAKSAIRTALLLVDAGAADAVMVLSDDNGRVPHREQHAGRITAADGLSDAEWTTFAAGANQIARGVRDQTGLRTVFHPHCGGFVETPDEIDQLMRRTDQGLLGLCLDTGHIRYGGGDGLSVLERHADRVWHVHFKDCDEAVAADARSRGLGYLAAVRARLFGELGKGGVDFGAVVAKLKALNYDGWIVVEQDVFPGYGTPAESARRNRDYLKTIGL